MAECEQAIERAAEIAAAPGQSALHLGDRLRTAASRLLDHGDRAGAEALLHRAGSDAATPASRSSDGRGALPRLLRADGSTTARPRPRAPCWEAIEAGVPRGSISAVDHLRGGARRRSRDRPPAACEPARGRLRRVAPSPTATCLTALCCWRSLRRSPATVRRASTAASAARAAAPLSDSDHADDVHRVQRPSGTSAVLELLAEDIEAAVGELRACGRAGRRPRTVVWPRMARVDLAIALHRRGDPGDSEEARAVLAEGERSPSATAMRWVESQAALARAELDGRRSRRFASPPPSARPVRALTARGGRRALAAMVRGQDDEALERRFSDPRRQRALLRAMARGFQPAHCRRLLRRDRLRARALCDRGATRCPLALGDRGGLRRRVTHGCSSPHRSMPR